MFTGIVQGVGSIDHVDNGADGADGARALWVTAELLDAAELGASVSVNGVCLTVTDGSRSCRRFDVSPETLARSTIGVLKTGSKVNLERPLRAGDELGGHIVQGHVDGVGRVERLERGRDGVRLTVWTEPALLRYVVEKGSVTLDGVSLTVSDLGPTWFEVALIPHTLAVTTLGELEAGHSLNIEVDVLAKFVERLVAPWSDRTAGVAPESDAGYL